ncbi:UNVERIFIED_CONTAM: hypothetical protein HDU68_004151, partial [Siphonaria sp. JEL0065]
GSTRTASDNGQLCAPLPAASKSIGSQNRVQQQSGYSDLSTWSIITSTLNDSRLQIATRKQQDLLLTLGIWNKMGWR